MPGISVTENERRRAPCSGEAVVTALMHQERITAAVTMRNMESY
jgi:hypothetical protein